MGPLTAVRALGVAAAFAQAGASSSAVDAAPAPSAAFTDFPHFLYHFYEQHCPQLPQPGCMRDIDIGCDCDIADAPLRFWYNGTDFNTLASVDLGSRGFYGPTLPQLQHSCTLYANSTNNMDITAFADHEWIHSGWYFPGNNSVYALTHNEYHCDRPGCPLWPNPGSAKFITGVTLMQSLDGGRSWQHSRPPPAHIVAVRPYAWNITTSQEGRLGFRSPSSIVQSRGGAAGDDGWYYATVTANWGSNFLGQQAGACMMRTRDLTDPSSWLAWGGSAFNVSLSVSPWLQPGLDPAAHTCVPFTNTTYGSLAWSSLYGRYLYFGTADGDDNGGWWFGLSDDLVSWDSWTAVDTGGFVLPHGNGTITPPPPGTNVPGRFIKRQDPSDPSVWWEDPAGTVKRQVGSCTPCLGINACTSAVGVPDSVFYSLANRSDFSCALAGYNASGYSDFYYPTLVDPSVATRRPNLDEVGVTAQLYLVAQGCVNAVQSGGVMACSPFDRDGLLVRDVVHVPITFASSGGTATATTDLPTPPTPAVAA